MKTKILLFAFLCLFISFSLNILAQTNTFPSTGAAGIGTTTPNISSLLEVKSTKQGLLIPRMTLTQRNAIATPATGLLIYQTNSTPGFYYYTGIAWQPVSSAVTGANTSLSNLSATKINAALLPDTTNRRNFGSVAKSWKDIYLSGSVYLSGSKFISGNEQNLFIGALAGTNAKSNAYWNTGVGTQSLQKNTSGSRNTGFGYFTLVNNTTGSSNTAVGGQALENNTTGYQNTAAGDFSLNSNTTGNSNTAMGKWSLTANKTGSYNTSIGESDLYYNTASYNTAVGGEVLLENTTGTENTSLGFQSLYLNTEGNGNSSVGVQSLYNNTIGSNNTAMGNRCLYNNTVGSGLVGIGQYALFNNGIGASQSYDGVANTAIGSTSLYSNTIGYNNTASGSEAMYNNTTGYNNAAYGVQALRTNTTGLGNTAVGVAADVNNNSFQNATAIGYFAIVDASNKIRLGNGAVTIVESAAGSWTTSDGRFKNNIQENVKGLEFIKLLKPVTYNFDTRKFEEFLMQNYPDSIRKKRLAEIDKQQATLKASSIVQSGFVAQEVEEAIKKSGYNFNGVHVPENPTDNWSLSYEKLTVPLVKAVQELSKMNDAKDSVINAMMDDYNTKINALQNQINELKAMIVSGQSTTISSASLQQNIPNPFTHTTNIGYSLNQKFAAAQIVITDKSGKTLKSVKISESGKGHLNIDASTLASGAYQYSLIIDGRLIATKQMILVK